MRHRLGAWGAVAMLAAAAVGASEPALPPGVVEVDPGDPKCVTDGTVPRCSLRAALAAVDAAGGGVIRLAPGSVHSLAGVAAVNGLEGGSGLPGVTTEVTIEGNNAIVERSPAPGTEVPSKSVEMS